MDIVVLPTVSDKPVSEKRRINLFNTLSPFKLPIMFVYGKRIEHSSQLVDAAYTNMINSLATFKRLDYEYGLICEDDFEPHPNFMEELKKTVDLLPDDWRCLHLCPGYCWGRWFRRAKGNVGRFDPEGDMDGITVHESGRFFMNCDVEVLNRKRLWLGGPIAVLINKKHIDSFIQDFKNTYAIHQDVSDVILTRMISDKDFICREPQLGYENEQGGTSWA